jgi:hypothetical protein
MPVIFAGLRVATVSNIALVSVAAVVGGGALGRLFDRGLASRFYTPLIVGLVLSVLLALLADALDPAAAAQHTAVGPGEATGVNLFSYLLDRANWIGPSKTLDLLGEHLAYTSSPWPLPR